MGFSCSLGQVWLSGQFWSGGTKLTCQLELGPGSCDWCHPWAKGANPEMERNVLFLLSVKALSSPLLIWPHLGHFIFTTGMSSGKHGSLTSARGQVRSSRAAQDREHQECWELGANRFAEVKCEAGQYLTLIMFFKCMCNVKNQYNLMKKTIFQ